MNKMFLIKTDLHVESFLHDLWGELTRNVRMRESPGDSRIRNRLFDSMWATLFIFFLNQTYSLYSLNSIRDSYHWVLIKYIETKSTYTKFKKVLQKNR